MKNVKFDNNKSKRVMSKKEFGLQINLGEQLEEKVKNYTILLKKKKNNFKDYFEPKNRNISFYSSSSGDYSNDYYDKFLIKLNSLKKTSIKTITPDYNKHIQIKLKENTLKIDKNNFDNPHQNVFSNKKYRTILKQNLYKKKETKKNLNKENEEKKKNKEDNNNITKNIIQDNKNNNNLKEKVKDLKIITDEKKSYINDKPQKKISPLSKKKNTIKDDSNFGYLNNEIEHKKTKHFSSIKSKKTLFKQKENSLSNSLKNNQNGAKIKRQTSLKNENLKEKVKKSLIRKITNSLEETHNFNNNIKNYLFHPKKIDVENLLKKKKKNNIEKKEKIKFNDNSLTKIPTPSKKKTLIINTKKKNLFCCIPLC